jgi:hypothetical protein
MQQISFARKNVEHYETIAQLKSLCRGEMAAVESYRQAIEITVEDWIVAQFLRNLTSHQKRVQILRLRIMDLGGDPPESTGPWGPIPEAVGKVAAMPEDSSALSLLEQGEADGLIDYQSNLQQLDIESRRLVSDYILPQQRQTHRIVSEIRFLLS